MRTLRNIARAKYEATFSAISVAVSGQFLPADEIAADCMAPANLTQSLAVGLY